ncbi:MAG: hypothetical protein ACLVGL_03715 [Waltera sp.]
MAVLAIIIVLSQAHYLRPRTIVLCLLVIAGMICVDFYLGEGFLGRLFSAEDGGNIASIRGNRIFLKRI